MVKCEERQEAIKNGQTRYFTGKPCKHGHVDWRQVCSMSCMACARLRANKKLRALSPDEKRKYYDRKKPQKRAAARKYYRLNIDRLAKRRKAWRDANPDYFRDHYQQNKERLKQKSHEWYHANKQKALESQKVYAKRKFAEDPEHQRALGRKHRAKRRAIQRKAFIEEIDRRVVFVRDKGRCGICRKKIDKHSEWDIDHIIPLSKGGAESYDNVQLAHRKCNRSKAAVIPKGQPKLFQMAPAV